MGKNVSAPGVLPQKGSTPGADTFLWKLNKVFQIKIFIKRY